MLSFKGTIWACPECHQRMHIHEHRKRRLRYLDSCQFKTIITCNVPRVLCKDHGSQTLKVPWADKGACFTHILFHCGGLNLYPEISQ